MRTGPHLFLGRVYAFTKRYILSSDGHGRGFSLVRTWFKLGWGDEVSLHENSHSRSLRGFEVEVRGSKIFEAFLRMGAM